MALMMSADTPVKPLMCVLYALQTITCDDDVVDEELVSAAAGLVSHITF